MCLACARIAPPARGSRLGGVSGAKPPPLRRVGQDRDQVGRVGGFGALQQRQRSDRADRGGRIRQGVVETARTRLRVRVEPGGDGQCLRADGGIRVRRVGRRQCLHRRGDGFAVRAAGDTHRVAPYLRVAVAEQVEQSAYFRADPSVALFLVAGPRLRTVASRTGQHREGVCSPVDGVHGSVREEGHGGHRRGVDRSLMQHAVEQLAHGFVGAVRIVRVEGSDPVRDTAAVPVGVVQWQPVDRVEFFRRSHAGRR